ncbi:extracellular solute-binding protein [Paenibacillus agricola]|uniref:Extracellular solute-binding protein n=1 Tax=Paenibacillus agricola TaxID=2716264 RepID=A0ABX0J1H5_9BACL|nr:extracellular solute-binding protein [Paenibacillus agricola]NHN30172.1 extracellular solute-binding protein [Paenibacillus agricola]
MKHLLRSKRAVAASLSLSLMVVAGCSGGGTPAATPAAETKKEETGPVTFKVAFDYNVDPQGMSLTDNEYIKYLKEKTGVEIQINSPGTAGYVEKINVLMASGNYPDALALSDGDKDLILKYANDDLLADLSPYINDTAKYPNIKKYMPDSSWLPVTDKGKVWAFPYNRPDGLSQVVYVNKEWLTKLNLQPPKTIDEFYTVMKAFAEKDPDGNGKNDTFGLLTNSTVDAGARIFKAGFNAEAYSIKDGKVTPPEITNEYKEYLKYLNKLVAEKILDPEFPTITSAIFQQKFKTLRYGVISGFWHYPSGLEIPKDVMDKYMAIELPAQKDGKPSVFTYPSLNRHYIAIPKSTKNIDRLMKFLDWAVSPEGMKFSMIGIPDVNYKETNGKIEAAKQLAPIHWAFSLVRTGQLNDDIKKYIGVVYPPQAVDNLTMANKIGKLDTLRAALPYYPDLAGFNLKKIVDEYTTKAVLGNADVDKTWDEYVARWRSAGGDKAIQYWTDWYNKEGKAVVK